VPRRNDDALIEAIQRLPFKVAVAIASGFVLLAFLVQVLPSGQGWLSLLGFTRLLWWSLAFFVLVASGISLLRRAVDGRLFDSGLDVADLTWEQFESYLAEFFRRHGSTVTYRGGASADGGVDLVLDDATGRRIVQAKHWKARSVDVVTVRALWGVREDERAVGAIVVTSGTFTRDAVRFAQGKSLDLIDGPRLRRMVSEVRKTKPEFGPVSAPTSNACPRCGKGRIVEKRAKRGRNAGSVFLGCDRFPRCRYKPSL
jgi:restriction system protein